MPYPTAVDECCDRLRRAGWSFGWCSLAPGGAERWLVDGHNGENTLRAEAATLGEALRLACEQARAGRSRPGGNRGGRGWPPGWKRP